MNYPALRNPFTYIPQLFNRLRLGPVIGVDELHRILKNKQDLLLLDVRTEDDYRGELGHVEGSLNIPLESLETHLDQLDRFREAPIAFICTTDRRSKKAARLLNRHGFSRVLVVPGGMTDWIQKSYPVNQNL
jgi:rhodanese-related sulfurtransferase